MTPEQQGLLEKASRSLQAARSLRGKCDLVSAPGHGKRYILFYTESLWMPCPYMVRTCFLLCIYTPEKCDR